MEAHIYIIKECRGCEQEFGIEEYDEVTIDTAVEKHSTTICSDCEAEEPLTLEKLVRETEVPNLPCCFTQCQCPTTLRSNYDGRPVCAKHGGRLGLV